jgi:hypothetical protein
VEQNPNGRSEYQVEALLRCAAEWEPAEPPPADLARRALNSLERPVRERLFPPAAVAGLLAGALSIPAAAGIAAEYLVGSGRWPMVSGQQSAVNSQEGPGLRAPHTHTPIHPLSPSLRGVPGYPPHTHSPTHPRPPTTVHVALEPPASERPAPRRAPARETPPRRARWEVEKVERTLERYVTPAWMVERGEEGLMVLTPGVLSVALHPDSGRVPAAGLDLPGPPQAPPDPAALIDKEQSS